MKIRNISLALRIILKNLSQSFITILSLSIGVASAILIWLFVSFHLSFDKFQPEYESSFRLQQTWKEIGVEAPLVSSSFNKELIKLNGIHEVLNLIDLTKNNEIYSYSNGRKIKLNGLFAVTSNVESFINLKVLSGDLKLVLNSPKHVALSVDEAYRLFGHIDILGQNLRGSTNNWTVSAIFENLQENTHFAFQALTSTNKEMLEKPGMGANNSYTYVKLINPKKSIPIGRYISSKYNDIAYQGRDTISIELLRLDKVHLNSSSQFEMKTNGSRITILVCVLLGILLIGISVINFANMSISQLGGRRIEVGIRKSLGASSFDLSIQLLVEYIIISFVSAIVALILVVLLLPWLSNITGYGLTLSVEHILLLLFVSIGAGIFSGLYPILFFSSLDARDILGSKNKGAETSTLVRKSLLSLQTAMSIGLIISAATIFQQLNHVRNLPVGYERDQRVEVVGIPSAAIFKDGDNFLLNNLRNLSGVENVGVIDTSLASTTNTSAKLIWPGANTDVPFLPFAGSGYGIVETLGLKLLAGRDFSSDFAADWYHKDDKENKYASIIITESIVRMAGFQSPEGVIGKTWKINSDKDQLSTFNVKIVGVVSDVQVGSSKNSTSPLFFICGFSRLSKSNIVINLNQGKIRNAITPIKNEINKIIDSELYDVVSIDEKYNNLYKDDQKAAEFILVFCGLTIFLTVIGIIGLSSYSAQCRSREFSIRKVLGASKIDLINLLAKEYIWLIIVGILISLPITYFPLMYWLADFNNRIYPEFHIYLFAGILVSTIIWLTIALTGLKYIRQRPADVLNVE
ncbi:FtsX-like permease family protein [Microbulbifer sp. EKSA005]|uniref:FtsX-like permease family protein n=1 Tax=Microbulbifer sp. EKSA005 TaxID=3243364 RepID=UPI004041A072